jgi:predicted Zn-dependent protease with MMP-like domain
MTSLHCSREVFSGLVEDALQSIPPVFRKKMENIAVTIEWESDLEIRQDLGLAPQDDLLGLYQGQPLRRRGVDYGNVLPDKITIYQKPLLARCPDLENLKLEIRKTVWHEVGHYFGLDDKTLRQLEQEQMRAAGRRKRRRT